MRSLTNLTNVRDLHIENGYLSQTLHALGTNVRIGTPERPLTGVYAVNLDFRVVAEPPLHADVDRQTTTVSLMHDATLEVVDGKLHRVLTTSAPLTVDAAEGDRLGISHDATLRISPMGELGVSPQGVQATLDALTFEEPLGRDANSIGLLHDGSLTINPSGQLCVAPQTLQAAADLLTCAAPLHKDGDQVTLKHDATLYVSEAGELGVAQQVIDAAVDSLTYDAPLHRTENSVGVALDPETLTVDPQGRLSAHKISYGWPIVETEQHHVDIAADDTLRVTDTGGLGVDPEWFKAPLGVVPATETEPEGMGLSFADPLTVDAQGMLALKLHKSLTVEDHLLATNITNVLKTFGALYNGTGREFLDMLSANPLEWLDEAVDFGALEEELGDTSVNVMRLRTSGQFSQKGSKLSLLSPGYQRVPFWSLTYDFLSDSSFYYSESLQTLNVKYVSLNESVGLSMTDDRAVWKGYLKNYYVASQSPSGSAISIGNEFNHQKEIGVRCDNKTIRINTVNNELQSGLVFQQANGVRIENENNVKIHIVAEKGLVFSNGNKLDASALTASAGCKRVENDFQSSLTFGTGLKQTGENVEVALVGDEDISYSAGVLACNITGDGVTIVKAGPVLRANYIAGAGIMITGNVISAISPTMKTQNNDETTQQSSNETTSLSTAAAAAAGAAAAAVVVCIAGPIESIVPVPTGPFPIPWTGAAELILAFPWASIVGETRKKKRRQMVDEAGEPVTNGNGEPVYEWNDEGTDWEYELDSDGAPVQEGAGAVTIGIDLEGGCTRMFMDSPSCATTDMALMESEQVVNFDLLRRFDEQLVRPAIDALTNQQALFTETSQLELLYATKNFVDAHSWDWNSQITNRPAFGTLALKNSVVLDGSEVTGTLPAAKIDPLMATKAYVDAQTVSPGAGLTKTGTVMSVNAGQPEITSLGTLTGLTVAGTLTMSGYRRLALSGGNSAGYLYSAFNQLQDGIQMGYNAYNDNTAWTVFDATRSTSRVAFQFGAIRFFTGAAGAAPTTEHMRFVDGQPIVITNDLTLSGYRRIWQLGGNSSGGTYGAYNQLGDGIHVGYNAYNDNTTWKYSNASGASSRIAYQYGALRFYTGAAGAPPTNLHMTIVDGTGAGSGITMATPVAMQDTLTLSKNAVAATAPTLGTHLCNKTYVDARAGEYRMPPVGLGMTSSAPAVRDGVTYTYTASSNPTYAWLAADDTTGTGWWTSALNTYEAQPSGLYVGTASTMVGATTLGGEWWQVQTSSGVRLSAFEWFMGTALAVRYAVLGSNDGTAWTMVLDNTAADVTFPTNATTRVEVGSTATYTYHRLVITKSNNTFARVTEFHLMAALGPIALKQTVDYATDVINKPAAAETVLAGTGLTKTGSTLSVNAAQTQITSVGTLTSLGTTGNVVSNTAGTGNVYTGQFWTPAMAVGGYNGLQIGVATTVRNSAVVGFVNAGGNGASTNNCFIGLVGASKVRINGLGDVVLESVSPSTSTTTGALVIPGTGGAAIGGNVNVGGVLSTNIGTGGSIHYTMKNGGSQRWGMGLSGTEGGTVDGSDFALWCFQNDGTAAPFYSPLQIKRADGTLQAVAISVSGLVTAPTAPTLGTHLTNRAYVDGKTWDYATQLTGKPTIETILAGSGLTKTASTLSVNASQPQITSVGTLTSLTAAGDIVSTGGDIYAGPQHWYHVRGTGSGILWDTYNSGWVCSDSTWIRSVAGKGIMTSGQVNAGSVYAYTVECGSNVTTNQLECTDTLFARGWMCKAGWSGAYNGTNKINFNWTGSSIHVWIDDVLVGTMQTYSSVLSKKDIRKTSLAGLDMVGKMRVVDFRYKDEGIFKDTGEHVGFVAQELKEISPRFVEEVDESMSLNPTALIAVLTKAVQELTARVEALEKTRK